MDEIEKNDSEEFEINIVDIIVPLIRQKKLLLIGLLVSLTVCTLLFFCFNTKQVEVNYRVSINELPQMFRSRVYYDRENLSSLALGKLSDERIIGKVNSIYPIFNLDTLSSLYLEQIKKNVQKNYSVAVRKIDDDVKLNNEIEVIVKSFKAENDVNKFMGCVVNMADNQLKQKINVRIKNLGNNIEKTLDSIKTFGELENYSFIGLKQDLFEIERYLNENPKLLELDGSGYVIKKDKFSMSEIVALFIGLNFLFIILAYVVNYFKNNDLWNNILAEAKKETSSK